MALKIRIDGTKCRGHGLCVIAAPELFEVVGLGMAQSAPCNLADPRTRALVDKAIDYCCEKAIRIEES